MSWMRRVYPVLFVLFPLFGMAAANPGWYRLRSVFLVAAAMLVATVALGVVLTVCFRVRYSWAGAADRAALLTFLAVVAVYTFEPLQIGPAKQWAATRPIAAVVVLVLIAGLAALALRRQWHARLPTLHAVAGYLTIFATLLCGWSLARVLYFPASTAIAVHESAFVDSLEQPVPLRAGGHLRGPARDVFVIVLDEYPSSDVLRERFGYDNDRFVDSLRALGFRIPSALRSNYANTLMSVGSLVNFAQTGSIADAAGRDSHDYGPAAYLIEHNRAERFLKSQGYRYEFFPSAWFSPTRYSSEADVEFYPYAHFRLGRRMYRSQFVDYFVRATLLDRLLRYMGDRRTVNRNHAVLTLAGVAALEPTRGPTFAFAHVLMPHTPYFVDAACHPARVPQRDPRSMGAELSCLDSLVLQTVTTLLARSRVPPVIILQGDHGTQSLGIFGSAAGAPTKAQLAERFRPFGAYYLPDGGGAVVPDTTSIVNVMRYVLSYYFDADLPALPNTMYYSHWRYPYRLTPLRSDFTLATSPSHAPERAHPKASGRGDPTG